MSRFYKIISLLIAIIVLLPAVCASSNFFDATIETVQKNIYPDEFAKFNVTLTNHMSVEETFLLSSTSKWILSTSDQFAKMGTSDTKTVTISLKPRSGVTPGNSYSVPLSIKGAVSKNGRTFNLPIYVKSYDSMYQEYIPAVSLDVEYDEAIEPTQDFKLKIKLRNRNALDLKNMTLLIKSDLFEKKLTESISPLQEKTVQASFELDNFAEPKTHMLDVLLQVDNETFAESHTEIKIKEYSNIDVQQEKVREFLSTITTLSSKNYGNVASTKTIEVQKNWFQRLFISAEPEYTLGTSEGKPAMSWQVTLEPNQEVVIKYTSNYRLLFVIGLAIILTIYLYFALRSPIVLIKKAKVLHTKTSAEGISRIKVRVFMKNRTGKRLHDVEVREKISKMMEVVEEKHTLGSPKPSKIIRGKTATLAKWEFDALEPYEERIITYKLESKLKLIGSLEFLRTRVKFRNQDGKLKRNVSNRLVLELIKKK
jgi:hypothetical protein